MAAVARYRARRAKLRLRLRRHRRHRGPCRGSSAIRWLATSVVATSTPVNSSSASRRCGHRTRAFRSCSSRMGRWPPRSPSFAAGSASWCPTRALTATGWPRCRRAAAMRWRGTPCFTRTSTSPSWPPPAPGRCCAVISTRSSSPMSRSLFERYAGPDVVAREEVYSGRSIHGADCAFIDEPLLERLAGHLGRAVVPPFNLGVVLYNHGVVARLAGIMATFLDDAWRLMTRLDDPRVSQLGRGRRCLFPVDGRREDGAHRTPTGNEPCHSLRTTVGSSRRSHGGWPSARSPA